MYRREAAATLDAALDRGERTVREAVALLHPTLVGDDRLAPYDPDGRLLANMNTPDDLRRWPATNAGNRTAATETSQTTNR